MSDEALDGTSAAVPAVMMAAIAPAVHASPQPPPVVMAAATMAGTSGDPDEDSQDTPPTSAEGRHHVEADEAGGFEAGRTGHSKKNAWTAEEDLMLSRIIAEQGHGHWTKVAAYLPGRMGRQCRERWFNHLAPSVKKGDWSREEDQLIVAAVREHGTKWSLIQKSLPGRSDNSIKNRYYSAIRKAQRLEKRSVSGAPGLAHITTDAEMSPTDGQLSTPTTQTNSPTNPTAAGSADAAAMGIVMRYTSDGKSSSPSSPSGKRKQRTAAASDAAVALLGGGFGQPAVTALMCAGPGEAPGEEGMANTIPMVTAEADVASIVAESEVAAFDDATPIASASVCVARLD